MKNLLSLLLLCVILVSCTENNTDDQDSTKSKVEFKVVTEGNTSKSIQRGNIPVYVDNLTIKALHEITNTTVQETFEFTGPVTNTFPALTLDDVLLGRNTFSATSTSSNSNKVLNLVSSNANNLDILKAKTPYIPCYSYDNPSPEIKKTGNLPITLKMKSDYGRILSLFKIGDVADKYVIVIKAYVNGATTALSTVEIRPETINRTATFEWSNEIATKGKSVKFDILICEKNSNTVLNTITKTLTIQAEKSLSCVYTINKDDVETDIQSGGILITFPKIDEIECNGGCD